MPKEHQIEEYDPPEYPELESRRNELPRVTKSFAERNPILGRCSGVFCNKRIAAFAETAGETFYIGEFGVGGTVLYCSAECVTSDAIAHGFGCSDIQMAEKR
jgi:hypothetical protein